MKPRVDTTMTLSDARRLAYAEWGEPAGYPMIFFHGSPSGRLLHHPDPQVYEGVRWITVDRPGYGGSERQPRRRLLDWPQDVAALADHLGLETFGVVGLSGGGPHALVCAHAMPRRVRRAAIVSGMGILTPETLRRLFPERRLGVRIARWTPWLLRPLIALTANPHHAERAHARVVAQCPSDRSILLRPDVREMLIANWTDANGSGLHGFASDACIFARPWGFDPAAIQTSLRFWHGDSDESVPIDMARALASTVPNASLEVISGAGHFLFFDRFRDIVGWVKEGARAGSSPTQTCS